MGIGGPNSSKFPSGYNEKKVQEFPNSSSHSVLKCVKGLTEFQDSFLLNYIMTGIHKLKQKLHKKTTMHFTTDSHVMTQTQTQTTTFSLLKPTKQPPISKWQRSCIIFVMFMSLSTAIGNIVRPAQFHRWALVELRRRADHHLHHQPQRQARPSTAAAGTHGRSRSHVLLHPLWI